MYYMELLKKAKCSDKDKKKILPLMGQIISLSEKARREGLLSLELEDDLKLIDSFLLKKGLTLVVDGMDPETVKNICYNYLYSSLLKGKELLEGLVIIEGCLSIQDGDNPGKIIEKLASLFGMNFKKIIDNYFDNKLDKPVKQDEDPYAEEVEKMGSSSLAVDPEISKENNNKKFIFEDIIYLADRTIQKLVREINKQIFAKALKGASPDLFKKVFKNMSIRAGEILKEDMEHIGTIRINDIKECQDQISNIIQKLRDQGDIIIEQFGDSNWK